MTKKQQAELYDMLKKRQEYYQEVKHSCASVEITQQILLSIEFCMNSYYKSLEDPEPYGVSWGTNRDKKLHDDDRMEDIYDYGMESVNGCIKTSKELWMQVKSTMIPVNHQLYENTIKTQIPDFFAAYDPDFSAQLCPILPEYPLAVEITGLQGIEYIYEYLYHLYLENQLMGKFESNSLLELTQQGSQENMFEIVLLRAMTLLLLNQEVGTLTLTRKDCERVKQILAGLSIARVQLVLEEKAMELLKQLDLDQKDMIAYVKESVKKLTRRMVRALRDHTLIYLYQLQITNSPTADFEGKQLSQEEFRRVMLQIKKMHTLNDKLIMIKENVHNLNDLVKIIEESLAGEEYESVFSLLLPSERELLIKRVQDKLERCQDDHCLLEWERMILESSVEKEK